jgi:hypothetical protein
MTAATEEDETQLLNNAYAAYRNVFVHISCELKLAPYDHIQTFSDGGRRAWFYNDMLNDHAGHLANELNAIVWHSQQLAAWEKVLPAYDMEDRMLIIREFIDCPATILTNFPYALRQRFIYSVSHLSHQANLVTRKGWKEDRLPADNCIKQQTMDAMAKGWAAFPALRAELLAINDDVFSGETDSFRNKYNHRFPSRIEIGYTQFVTRTPQQGRVRYGLGGRQPLSLAALLPAVGRQHQVARRAFDLYSDLAREQIAAMAM